MAFSSCRLGRSCDGQRSLLHDAHLSRDKDHPESRENMTSGQLCRMHSWLRVNIGVRGTRRSALPSLSTTGQSARAQTPLHLSRVNSCYAVTSKSHLIALQRGSSVFLADSSNESASSSSPLSLRFERSVGLIAKSHDERDHCGSCHLRASGVYASSERGPDGGRSERGPAHFACG